MSYQHFVIFDILISRFTLVKGTCVLVKGTCVLVIARSLLIKCEDSERNRLLGNGEVDSRSSAVDHERVLTLLLISVDYKLHTVVKLLERSPSPRLLI